MGAAIVWIVLFIVIGTVVMTAILAKSHEPPSLPAHEVLKLRFANGEIDEAEYLRRMAVIDRSKLLELDD